MHQLVVTILWRLRPPLPEGETANFWYWKPPFSVGIPSISAGLAVPHQEIGAERWRKTVALNLVHV